MKTDKIKNYLKEYSYLKSIQSLLQWDLETMMPSGAIDDRAQRLSYIQGKIHSHITAKKYQSLLLDLKAEKKTTALEKKLIKELLWDFELQKKYPLNHVMEISEAQTVASHVWAHARKKNDWKEFKPHLEKLVELKRRETTFFKSKKPYDALIKLHDKEFDSARITALFTELKKGLTKLAHEVNKEGTFVKVEDLKGTFDIEKQKELSFAVARMFGLPQEHSRLDTSAHPFSINISPQDQRITTRYTTEHLDSLSSTMHEVGHALYELNLPREWEGTPLQEAVSLSVHESQSRFWENVIGRSWEFTQFIHPVMEKYFAKNMKGVDEKTLYRIFNKSTPGMIRVESCELYYNFHIIIRYEIEEMIFNQGLGVDELPQVWKEKYQAYLGLAPKTHAEGVMQDSHWAGAAFGYFPTYTLGNLISGSLYQQLKKKLPTFQADIRHGKFDQILNYLVQNIHSKGRSITSHDIVGELQVDDYLKYLSEKFKR